MYKKCYTTVIQLLYNRCNINLAASFKDSHIINWLKTVIRVSCQGRAKFTAQAIEVSLNTSATPSRTTVYKGYTPHNYRICRHIRQ